jgi:hypothetical protein
MIHILVFLQAYPQPAAEKLRCTIHRRFFGRTGNSVVPFSRRNIFVAKRLRCALRSVPTIGAVKAGIFHHIPRGISSMGERRRSSIFQLMARSAARLQERRRYQQSGVRDLPFRSRPG